MADVDISRRFGGVARLYGDAGLATLQAAHVVVIGIGGVGSWAAEALARNAVGNITLIDLDNIAESNVNRQIHALEGAFGLAKVSAMAARIKAINPLADVVEIEDFITPDNLDATFADLAPIDVIVDCIDDAKAKIALAAYCKQHEISLLMSGSAGGMLDPTRIQVADLAHVSQDKLLAKVRNQLRRHHDFPRASTKGKAKSFGVTCVFSDEPTLKPDSEACAVEGNTAITGLNCAGYGSSVNVTAPFGFVMANLAIQSVLA